jgi:hypothetical protein
MENQQSFELGRRLAGINLAAWDELGYPSQEACRARLQQVARDNLRAARQWLRSSRDQEERECWRKRVALCRGYLAALDS